MPHAVLLGDSVFDNRAYFPGGLHIVEQLRGKLPRGWWVTLLARDGAVTTGVLKQLLALPEDASHLVISGR